MKSFFLIFSLLFSSILFAETECVPDEESKGYLVTGQKAKDMIGILGFKLEEYNDNWGPSAEDVNKHQQVDAMAIVCGDNSVGEYVCRTAFDYSQTLYASLGGEFLDDGSSGQWLLDNPSSGSSFKTFMIKNFVEPHGLRTCENNISIVQSVICFRNGDNPICTYIGRK